MIPIEWQLKRDPKKIKKIWRPTAGFLFKAHTIEQAEKLVELANRTNRQYRYRIKPTRKAP